MDDIFKLSLFGILAWFVIFIITREVIMWYFKINKLVSLLESIKNILVLNVEHKPQNEIALELMRENTANKLSNRLFDKRWAASVGGRDYLKNLLKDPSISDEARKNIQERIDRQSD